MGNDQRHNGDAKPLSSLDQKPVRHRSLLGLNRDRSPNDLLEGCLPYDVWPGSCAWPTRYPSFPRLRLLGYDRPVPFL
jgi:hypothetical protein